jgi:protein-tyrosine phosphatase
VHCAAGKDRTGVLVALVLDAIGVERAAVVEDYVLSAEKVEQIFRRRVQTLGEEMPENIDQHKPRAETMVAVLDRLDADHARDAARGGVDGGAAGWLRANGIDDSAIARLRERLVVS